MGEPVTKTRNKKEESSMISLQDTGQFQLDVWSINQKAANGAQENWA